jgi:hypothetical protein
MNRTNRLLTFALLASLALALAADLNASEPADGIGGAGSCCFTNPRFNGVCQVVPAGDETCASILGYLNNPNSVGKTYCGNTQVRGGWAQIDCTQQSARSSSASAPACDAPDAGHLAGDGAL